MDNASIHRKRVIKEILESAGHQVVFLPKSSPDLNDIEHDFSTLKIARIMLFLVHLSMKLFGTIAPANVSFFIKIYYIGCWLLVVGYSLTVNSLVSSPRTKDNQRIPTQRIPTQRIPTQRIPTQRIPTQQPTNNQPTTKESLPNNQPTNQPTTNNQ
jgi:putative transposase